HGAANIGSARRRKAMSIEAPSRHAPCCDDVHPRRRRMKHARHPGSPLLATVTLALALGAPIPASAADHGGSLSPQAAAAARAARRARVEVIARSPAPPPQRPAVPPPAAFVNGASGSGAIEVRRDDGRLRRRAPESRATLAAAGTDTWRAGSVPASLRHGHPPASAAPFYEGG